MANVKPDQTIGALIKEHPQTVKVLASHHMMCLACQGSERETLRHAAQNHGVDLAKLIEELKRSIMTE